VNVVLAVLAIVSVAVPASWVVVATLVAGAALVAWLLRAFARGKRR